MRREKNMSEAKKEMILDTAVALFGKHGYHKTTITMVAEKANIYRSSVAFHFGNKKDLLVAVYKQRVEVWLQDIVKRIFLRTSTDNHAEVMRQMIAAFLEELKKDPEKKHAMHRIAVDVAHYLPEVSDSIKGHYLDLQQTLEAFIWSGQEHGTITKQVSAKAMSNSFMLLLLGCQSALYIIPEMGSVMDYLENLDMIVAHCVLD